LARFIAHQIWFLCTNGLNNWNGDGVPCRLAYMFVFYCHPQLYKLTAQFYGEVAGRSVLEDEGMQRTESNRHFSSSPGQSFRPYLYTRALIVTMYLSLQYSLRTGIFATSIGAFAQPTNRVRRTRA
jgi:hypothetical protein